MSPVSTIIFVSYFVGIVLLGILVARHKKNTTEQYFLAGRSIPWYAVGMSYIGSNVSTEHFIGMVGAAYIYGVSPANWELFSGLGFIILIWLFLPYYYRSKLFTMPEFLERRFDHRTRLVFALLLIFHGVFVVLSSALYAGGRIINDLFFQNVEMFNARPGYGLLAGIIIIAIATGAYCIYGGLLSVIWTDVVQVVVMFTGGIAIAFLALHKAGGLQAVFDANAAADSARMHLLQPATDDFTPWTGMVGFTFTICLWAICTKQYYVQRCLAAKSEWDARMGVVFAGFLKSVMPFMVVLPGMMAFAIYGKGLERDSVYLTLVTDLMPASLCGLMLAAMASAIMSTISSVLNSSATMFSLDIYKRFIKRDSSDESLVRIGRWTTTIIIIFATIWAPYIAKFGRGLFIYMQDMNSYIASPIAAIFTLGILWKRATANAASATLVFGVVLGIVVKVTCYLLQQGNMDANLVIIWLDSFLNRTFVVWIACMVFMIIVSYYTTLPSPKKISGGIIWNREYSRIPTAERQTIPFRKSLGFWSLVMLSVSIILYLLFI